MVPYAVVRGQEQSLHLDVQRSRNSADARNDQLADPEPMAKGHESWLRRDAPIAGRLRAARNSWTTSVASQVLAGPHRHVLASPWRGEARDRGNCSKFGRWD